MAKKTIADHVVDLMREHGSTLVSFGDLDVLGEAYVRYAGESHGRHPLDANEAVLNALSRDSRFEKGYIRLHRRCRCFTLKEEASERSKDSQAAAPAPEANAHR